MLSIGLERVSRTCDVPQNRCFPKEGNVCPGKVKSSLRECRVFVCHVQSVGERFRVREKGSQTPLVECRGLSPTT